MNRYAIVVERAGRNYSAYVPDLPGCVATGKTVEATERLHGPRLQQWRGGEGGQFCKKMAEISRRFKSVQVCSSRFKKEGGAAKT
jgi:hypothetical protein